MESPKKRFLLDDAEAKKWSEITKTPLFKRAVDAALLEVLENQPLASEDAQNLLGRTYHMQGARLFARVLEKLGDAPAEPPKPASKTLDY